MARNIRFTKAERDFLKSILVPTAMDWSSLGTRAAKTAASVLAKVEESEAKAAGVDVAPIEGALIAAARGKVLPLEGGYARASVVAAQVGATVETAKLVGGWMARQGWLNQPQTLLDVLNKWYQWLPKARATEPPPSLPAGLGPAGAPNAVDGRGPAPPGQANPKRRSSPGFR